MRQKLANIDNLLAKIEVKGDSAFLIVEARRELKAVYDEVIKNETSLHQSQGQQQSLQ